MYYYYEEVQAEINKFAQDLNYKMYYYYLVPDYP